MHDVSAYVVVEILKNTIDAVDGLEVALDVVPVGRVVPDGAWLGVVQKGHHEEPKAVDEVGHHIVVEDKDRPEYRRQGDEESDHGPPEDDGSANHAALLVTKELGLRIHVGVVGHLVAVSLEEVERVGQGQHKAELLDDKPGDGVLFAVVLGLDDWVEDLIALVVSGILVVLAVGDPPRVEGDENGRVQHVAHKRVDLGVARE
mmetsp:Transcript_42095/g.103558  ORF Transcript_42095/g.103558 Transcript_42095/m.103558 type:complete len:203 (-) Transcript_42095:470-1078(-)